MYVPLCFCQLERQEVLLQPSNIAPIHAHIHEGRSEIGATWSHFRLIVGFLHGVLSNNRCKKEQLIPKVNSSCKAKGIHKEVAESQEISYDSQYVKATAVLLCQPASQHASDSAGGLGQ